MKITLILLLTTLASVSGVRYNLLRVGTPLQQAAETTKKTNALNRRSLFDEDFQA